MKVWAATAKARKNIKLVNITILKDSIISITKGEGDNYCLWARDGVYVLNKEYVDEKTIKIISK